MPWKTSLRDPDPCFRHISSPNDLTQRRRRWEKAFEYYNKPSLGISVLRLDHHLGGEVMSKTKIEEWCRERQAGTSSESGLTGDA